MPPLEYENQCQILKTSFFFKQTYRMPSGFHTMVETLVTSVNLLFIATMVTDWGSPFSKLCAILVFLNWLHYNWSSEKKSDSSFQSIIKYIWRHLYIIYFQYLFLIIYFTVFITLLIHSCLFCKNWHVVGECLLQFNLERWRFKMKINEWIFILWFYP